jgi:hypothetical protein
LMMSISSVSARGPRRANAHGRGADTARRLGAGCRGGLRGYVGQASPASVATRGVARPLGRVRDCEPGADRDHVVLATGRRSTVFGRCDMRSKRRLMDTGNEHSDLRLRADDRRRVVWQARLHHRPRIGRDDQATRRCVTTGAAGGRPSLRGLLDDLALLEPASGPGGVAGLDVDQHVAFGARSAGSPTAAPQTHPPRTLGQRGYSKRLDQMLIPSRVSACGPDGMRKPT